MAAVRITDKKIEIEIAGDTIGLRRATGGVIEMWANDDLGLAKAHGFAHAHDRLVQMMLVRLIGQGRLSETLEASDDTLAVDLFMRNIGFGRCSALESERLSDRARAFGEAFCAGVNQYLDEHFTGMELRLLGYRPESWTVADTLLTIKMMSYVGLAQTQQDAEKLIAETVAAGVDVERLRRLFAPHLNELGDDIIDALKQTRFAGSVLPAGSKWLAAAPALRASNSWAVGPGRSVSGHALQCNDPHLECNRLPAIWYEFIAHTADDYRTGVTVPGVPGVVMGRTSLLSFGFTYGFMDQVDYFVEEVKDGRVRRGKQWVESERIDEVILRKKKEPVVATFWQTSHGVLETDPQQTELDDGFYLCRAYSAYDEGSGEALDLLSRLPHAATVEQAQDIVCDLVVSANWVLADRDGNIGYQQSGYLPDRAHSGLHPVPGWDERYAWKGRVPGTKLARELNPERGFIASANANHNSPGGPLAINLHQGPYRADRLSELLAGKPKLSLEDMERIQTDLLSNQARRYMEVLQPLLPDTPRGRVLVEWDLHFSSGSRGAPLFEQVYRALLDEVFAPMFGAEAWKALWETTGLVHADYFWYFDNVVLDSADDDELWFGERGREAIIKDVLMRVLEGSAEGLPTWGEQRQVMMNNILFAGKLPSLARVDRGPISVPGHRGSVVQGSIFMAAGRKTTFTPSWRYITDLGTNVTRTVLAGGPSGRPWSKWYASDVPLWMRFQYKTLKVE